MERNYKFIFCAGGCGALYIDDKDLRRAAT